MKIINTFITIFWITTTFVLGLSLVFSFFGLFDSKESLNNVFQVLTQSPWSLFFGLFFLVIASAFIFLSLQALRKERYIAFENPNGEVTISVKAVEDFIYRITKDFVEIKEIHPSIASKNDGVSIGIQAVLWSGANIPEVTERIQTEVKKQVQTILGIENIANVEIKVTRIETRGTELSPKTDLFEEENY